MNTLRVSLLLILGFLACARSAWALDPSRRISQYAHTAWTAQDGYLPGRSLGIGQTTDGYLWIGTQAGLLRFDGVRFDKSSPPMQRQPAFSSARIGTVLGARDGSLWIGAQLSRGQGRLSRWTGHGLLTYPVTVLGDPYVYQTRGGDLWLANPLCRIVGSELRCYGKTDGISGWVSSIAEDGDGDFLLGTKTAALRWTPGTRAVPFHSLPRLKANPSASVRGIVVAPDGSWWAGMNQAGPGMGLERLVHGKWTSAVGPGVDSSKWEVEKLLLDRDGALWVGTLHGLYHIYGGRVDHFGRADGLSSDNVENLFEDREGDIWAATDGGIDRFRDTTVEAFSRFSGFCLVESDSLLVTHNGTLWVGAEGALVVRRGNRFVCLPLATRLPGHQVTSLFEDDAHQLWIGVDDKIGVYKHDHFTELKGVDEKSLGMIVAIAEDGDHNLWMISGGSHRALFRIRDRRVEQELTFPGMAAPHSVAVDPTGGIWLGLMNGDLAHYRNGHTEVVHFDRRADSIVMQIAVRPDGSVLGASGSGLLGWKDGKRLVMTTRNGLPCDAINTFITDNSGSLWLNLPCGFVEITAAQLQRWWADPDAVLKLHVLDALDGMQAGAAFFQSLSAKTPDGRLWFGGSALQMIDPAHRHEGRVAPLVHVEQLVADQKRYALERPLELPALTRYIEIDYTAPIFAIPQRVRFRYKLEGLDRDWQDVGTRRDALYTDLGPGRYTFRVAASNSGGPWSTTDASVGFVIVPAFYQARWFYVICAIACLALLTLTYRVRVRQIAAEVRGRMEARLAERERIARDLHDTLLQGMQGLIWRFQVASNRIPEDQPARQLMKQSLERADKLLEEGRDRLKELRPAASQITDLAQALGAEGEELAKHQLTRFRTSVHGNPRALHPIVREEVFLIGREALSNAFRHSGAKDIEAEVTYGDVALHVRVRDDGRGISAAALEPTGNPHHFGLMGMRERAKKLGGKFEIWSKPDAGTEVDLRVPAHLAYGPSQVPSPRARSWLAIFRSSGQPH
jgi:signal transduction histidine kinase/ligand-binding sensor domain-containing protein